MSPVNGLSAFTTNLKNVVFLITLITGICGALLSGTTYAVVKYVWPILLDELRIELNVATKDDISYLWDRIDDISGENRVFMMMDGQSYVAQPVHVGEPVTLILALKRTKYGVACVFVEGTPLFMDDRNIPFPGQKIEVVKQVGLLPERLSLDLKIPQAVQPGRIGLTLSLEYRCPFGSGGTNRTVFNETEMVFFQLDPSKDTLK